MWLKSTSGVDDPAVIKATHKNEIHQTSSVLLTDTFLSFTKAFRISYE